PLQPRIDVLRQRHIFRRVSGVPMVEAEMEALQILRPTRGNARHQLLGLDPLGFGFEHDRGAMRVIRAHEMHLISQHPLEAHPDVGLDVLHDVPDVKRAVGVGKGGSDEDFAGHPASLAGNGGPDRRGLPGAPRGAVSAHIRVRSTPPFQPWSRIASNFALLMAFLKASLPVIWRLSRSCWIAVSMVRIPKAPPACMTFSSWSSLPWRMRLAAAFVLTRISRAATRPCLSARCRSCCDTTPRKEVEIIVRTCDCLSDGKTLMIRSTVGPAPLVCSVPMTRIPSSAAVTAMLMVSRSRNSPTRMTSGSSRNAECSAAAKLELCTPISRWLMRQFLRWCTNSIGSSMVRMWPRMRLLMSSIIAASVVD